MPERLDPNDPAYNGQAVYTPFFLNHVYDPLVVRFANRFTWRCSSRKVLDLYDACVSDDHLDVGPGTGWYLRRCAFPSRHPRVALMDVNADVLATASRRLSRHRPETILMNVLEPLTLPGRTFGSIGLTHVMHCLPGSLPQKAGLFDRLTPMLRPGGVLFGSTILAQGVRHTKLGRSQLDRMNRSGIFSNTHDSAEDLEQALADRFADRSVRIFGGIALFSAVAP
jgi:SAM-dependent methyltransferase